MTHAIDDRFQAIASMMSTEPPPLGLRAEILDLIVAVLDERKDQLGYWEKCHIGGALNALSTNLGRGDPASRLWLNLCMVNLDKALVPADQRDEGYAPRYKAIAQITHAQLLEAAEILRSRVPTAYDAI
jgi:hypothetical protein